jgi:hypothetical protein
MAYRTPQQRYIVGQDDINGFVWAMGKLHTFTPEYIKTAVLC